MLQVLEEVDYQWMAISQSNEILPNHYLTTKELTFKKYSYISSTRRYTTFRDAFFTNPKDVRSNVTVADTYLYDGVESLTMKQNQDIISFQSVLNDTNGLNIFEMSFPYVQRIGTSYGSIRVLNQDQNQIDYRMFVEGFPIFGSDFEGQLAFEFSDHGQNSQKKVSIQGNLKSLQIPIPSKEEVILPATQTLVENLHRQGADLQLIRTFLIGYEWKNLENTGVVDLIPNWFVKYGDRWLSYEALLSQLKQGRGSKMDFKRIEWIFFFAFLGLNLFLFSMYREAKLDQNITSRTNETIPLYKRLASENIKYEGDFSARKRDGYYLSGVPTDFEQALKSERERLKQPDLLSKQTTIDENVLTHTINDVIMMTDRSQVEEVLSKILNQPHLVLFGDEYQYIAEDTNLMNDNPEIVAGQYYEEIPINDPASRLTLRLEKEADHWSVDQYIQTHISELQPLRESMPTYSEREAINTLYINNQIPPNSKILWRKLAYKMTLIVRGQAIFVPTWFIQIETNNNEVKTEMVNAFTNRIITNSVIATVEDQK
ncbi:two-component system regulatory protein YycI [Enterococcus alcedinis]